jgi:hypothetical protein
MKKKSFFFTFSDDYPMTMSLHELLGVRRGVESLSVVS